MRGMFNVADELAPSAFQAFDVKDDLKLSPKKSPTSIPATAKPATAKPAAVKPAAAKPATAAPAAAKSAAAKPATNGAAKTAKSAVKVTPIELKIAEGADPNVAWNDYFAAHPDVAPEQVRETARQLVHAKKYDEAIAMVHAALRNGAPQPWMYEALSLAMQAAGRPIAEVERALTSAIDFAESPEDFMYVAQYMARMGMERRALTIFHQVSLLDPLRPEPYLFGLQLAQRTGDLEGMQWASLGILRQAWPKDKQELVASAARTAAAVVEQLKKANRSEEAATFAAQLAEAKVRDCLVKVTWTGSADVDLMVEEPTSTICSFRNPRTAGGGVLLGDTAARKVAEGLSETYICPEAFNGTYKVRLSRVWGKVTAGKVTVDVYSNYGSQNERHIRQQIPLGEEDQLLVFDLTEGRRKEALADYQLAQAATVQMGVNQAILSQQIASEASTSGGNAALVNSRQGLIGVPFIQQAVGYMPVITVLPSGTMLQVNGVVSADRRYVRISPTPFFSGISSVTTFNLLQGATSTTSGSGTGGTAPGATPPGGNPNQGAAGT